MPKGNTLKQDFLNYVCRNVHFDRPSQLYMCLYTTNPTDADIGTEASYVGYQRQPVTFGTPTLSGGNAVVQNSAEIQFPIVPSASGSVAYVGFRTAASGGTLMYYGSLGETYQLNTGVQPIVPVGTLSITES